jgi:phosphoglycerol transferase MdoB-like AlkP superfamily enzyme
MPHAPYYYNKSGELRPKGEWVKNDTSFYLEYLEYTNRQLLKLVDSIQKKSDKKAAILLIGDHGVRTNPIELPIPYHFQTLTSIYLPKQQYSHFYPSISHVNLLRATVNSLFGEKMKYLKDSTIYLQE